MSKSGVITLKSANEKSKSWPTYIDVDSSGHKQDLFLEQDGLTFAGTHLIVDMLGACSLDNITHIEQALRNAVKASSATLLHIHLHQFTPNGGVSGVAVLAESHISIHTWPERDFAALDIFMCGTANPGKAIDVLKQAFRPDEVKIISHKRGILPQQQQKKIT